MRPLLSQELRASMLRFRIAFNVAFRNELHGEGGAVVDGAGLGCWHIVQQNNLLFLLRCLILHLDAATFVHNRFRLYCACYVMLKFRNYPRVCLNMQECKREN